VIAMLVLTFQIGSDRLALDVRRVREVVPRVRWQPVAGSPPWLAGVFLYRGRVVPVIDLHRLVGAGECPPHLSTRVILVTRSDDGGQRLIGLLAARVDDIRPLSPPAGALNRLTAPGRPDLGPVLVDGRELIHLVELDRLLPESYESQLALVPQELPT
jgi:chemotaxis-related protein WspB